MELGRLLKRNAPLVGGGSFRWPRANGGWEKAPVSTPPLPNAGVGDVGDEVTTGILLPIKAIEGDLGNGISEILLLVVKPWSGNAFCCRRCR